MQYPSFNDAAGFLILVAFCAAFPIVAGICVCLWFGLDKCRECGVLNLEEELRQHREQQRVFHQTVAQPEIKEPQNEFYIDSVAVPDPIIIET